MNRKYTLKDILSACKYYNKETGREITFEYILFSGINDSDGGRRKTAEDPAAA